ncbi:hypothetical protein Ade02nite_17560 [Paractinoplanes deccanensis]|uniref:Nephrocystin 3-like N-terminal domain-containing protein n=1 Tax=Paractinoplanes deccanensis TaxID=113561 RepID=A0ABQ3XZI3_9ACTN|nr:hypothetical protein [Actinoplanes deccanensis]GID73115.1 hypothetical protein Ade02nite_17560 [Actinoplanes deccanensis]
MRLGGPLRNHIGLVGAVGALLFGVVANLATSTVTVAGPWATAAVWTVAGLIAATLAGVEVVDRRRRPGPAPADEKPPPGPGGTGHRDYLALVRDTAPRSGLLGRDAELGELAAFVRGPQAYRWMQADAWAGKSALMATFVTGLPPDVVPLVFLVTGRLAAHDDSAAFTLVLLEQLAELSGERLPDRLTPAGREALRRRLFAEVAEALANDGKRLVLVVDGLDEDQSARRGLPSIVSLLPKHPAGTVRVVVTSRPGDDLPADVDADHPMRSAGVVRVLSSSPYASLVRDQADRDLSSLLHAGDRQRDLLGLIAAARGGLTTADLEDLTGLAPYEMAETLDQAPARVIVGRPGGERVYLLAHQNLQDAVTRQLGQRRMAGYRARLGAWADRFRARRWPGDTPRYLLTGYPAMLESAGEIDRLVACVTDLDRHDRMRDVFGGDAAALSEIAVAQASLRAGAVAVIDPDPRCLPGLARVAAHLGVLHDRIKAMPHLLPVMWAVLDHPDRAEAMARSVREAGPRARVLASVAVHLGERHPERARDLVAAAEESAAEEPAGETRGPALAAAAEAAAMLGHPELAGRLLRAAAGEAERIAHPEPRAGLYLLLANVAAALAPSPDPAAAPAPSPDSAAASARSPGSASAPDSVSALALGPEEAAALALAAAREDGSTAAADRALVGAVRLAAATGRAAWTKSLLAELDQPGPRIEGRLIAADAFRTVDPAWARALVEEAENHQAPWTAVDSWWRFAVVAPVWAALGDTERAQWHVARAEREIEAMPELLGKHTARAHLALALARMDQADRALDVVAGVLDDTARDFARDGIAQMLAAAGRFDRARSTVLEIADPSRRAAALAALAMALHAAGEGDEALRVAALAETTVRSAATGLSALRLLATLADELARAGQHEQAGELVTAMAGRADVTPVLTQLARVAVALPDPAPAAALDERMRRCEAAATDDAVRLEILIARTRMTARVSGTAVADAMVEAASALGRTQTLHPLLGQVPGALAAAGRLDEAVEWAAGLANPYERRARLTEMARVLAEAGEPERARHLVDLIDEAVPRLRALFGLLGPSSSGDALNEVLSELAAVDDEAARRTLTAELIAALAGHLPPERVVELAYDLEPGLQAAERDPAAFAGDAEAYADLLGVLAQAWARCGRTDRSALAARAVAELAGRIEDRVVRTAVLAIAIRGLVAAGRHGQAAEVARSIERIAETARSPSFMAGALATTATAFAQAQRPDLGRALLARALVLDGHEGALRALAVVDPRAARVVADYYLNAGFGS